MSAAIRVIVLAIGIAIVTTKEVLLESICIHGCSCFGFNIHCDHRNFTHLPPMPTDNADDIDLLNLSRNQLTTVVDMAFISLSNLKILYLEFNSITRIEPKAFVGLTQLQELYLQFNDIQTLPSSAFNELFELLVLDMSHNRLLELPEAIFNATDLYSLDLSANQLTGISINLFHSTDNLTALIFSGNPLSSLPGATFSNSKHLHSMILRNIRLQTIDRDLYSVFGSLDLLDLSHDGLNLDVNWQVLRKSIKHLNYLNVSGIHVQCGCNVKRNLAWLTSFIPRASSPTCAGPENVAGQLMHDLIEDTLTCPKSPKQRLSQWYKGQARNLEPMPYDPMLGWYTASTLGAMLLCFLICIACDRVKQKVIMYHRVVTRPSNPTPAVNYCVEQEDGIDDLAPSQEQSSVPAITFEDDGEGSESQSNKLRFSFMAPSKREDIIANQCPREEHNKVPHKSITAVDPPLSPTLSLEPKLQIVEVNPECLLHSPLHGSCRAAALFSEENE